MQPTLQLTLSGASLLQAQIEGQNCEEKDDRHCDRETV
jgi:hypothetical protein